MKARLLFVLLITAVIAAYLFTNTKSNVTEVVSNGRQTEVIDYTQTYIPEISKFGNCWTMSIATPSNKKAWRCGSGDYIYDPCFEVGANKVVCDVDPEKSESGFTLNLTERLPVSELRPSPEEAHAWMYKLSPDIKCTALTGTAAFIEGTSYYYVCDNGAYIAGNLEFPVDRTKQPWQATLVYFEDNKVKKEIVSVLRVWR